MELSIKFFLEKLKQILEQFQIDEHEGWKMALRMVIIKIDLKYTALFFGLTWVTWNWIGDKESGIKVINK